MRADYRRQAANLTDLLARPNTKWAGLSNNADTELPALVAKVSKHQKLAHEVLIELIDHIKVYENGNISVKSKFVDEFRKIAEHIEINTTDIAEAG